MLTISGTGCALMDYLYTDLRLDSPAFLKYRSREPGDGGLEPGKLVFVEDLQRFAGAAGPSDASGPGEPFERILRELTAGRAPDRANLGGPSIVALIHAAQMLEGRDARVRFFGARGSDSSGVEIERIAAGTPLDMSGCVVLDGPTPFTRVFSDPTYDHGHGERTFVNELGVAAQFGPESLPPQFFDADIVAFGGTALVPRLHEGLGALCARAKGGGSIVVVNTVFDFKSEARIAAETRSAPASSAQDAGAGCNARPRPGGAAIAASDGLGLGRVQSRRWPLGTTDETYRHIDLLIADREEAFSLSGMQSVDGALAFFKVHGTGAAIVTDGARDIRFNSDGSLFAPIEAGRLPVSAEVVNALRKAERPLGDTTGCGDNFVGGLLSAVAGQLGAGAARGKLDMVEACTEAIVAGGFACFYIGGTYLEIEPGEKRRRIEALAQRYRIQRVGR